MVAKRAGLRMREAAGMAYRPPNPAAGRGIITGGRGGSGAIWGGVAYRAVLREGGGGGERGSGERGGRATVGRSTAERLATFRAREGSLKSEEA